MSDKYIFSTKSIGDERMYVFSEKHQLHPDSQVLNYRIKKTCFDESSILAYLDGLGAKEYDNLLDKCEITQNREDKKRVAGIMANPEERACKEYALASGLELTYYYTPHNNPDNVFAVKCLDGKPDVDWINVLIEDETIGTKLGKGDTLYLILHDKDVPGYDGETFKILSSGESSKIKNIVARRDQSNQSLKFNDFEIHIVVFNHVKNAITDILNKKEKVDIDVPSKVTSIFKNKDLLEKMFDTQQMDFSKLSTNGFVDLMNKMFNVSPTINHLKSGRKFLVYEDNGALLTELMHVRIDNKSSKQFNELTKRIQKEQKDMSSKKEKAENNGGRILYAPIIVKLYKNFFKDWENAVSSEEDKEKIRIHNNKKALEENLERVFSFFNNSSIWIRLVDMYDKKAYDAAAAEFEYFDKIGLYDYSSAWENLEYNLRICLANYLDSSLDGHGNYVTPVLYGSETEAREILCGNRKKL